MNDIDPVEEFFARERRDIHPAPGDDDHWAAIVDAHRRTRRSRWTGFAAGAAAAAVLVGGVGYLLRPGDGTTALPGAQTGSTSISKSSGPGASASTSPTPSGTSPTKTSPPRQTTAGVPADFHLVSLSNAGHNTMFGLGTTNCSGNACIQVIRSLDNGKSWRAVTAFRANDGVDPIGKTSSGKVGTDSSLTDIRMANQKVGWAFGGGLKVTTDGGFTWADYPHEGKAVIALETDGKQVVIVSTGGDCNGKSCTGDLFVQRAAVGEAAPTTVGQLSGDSIRGASITFTNGQAIVSPDSGSVAGQDDPPSLVTDKGLQPISLAGCSDGVAGTVIAPAEGTGLLGFCPLGGAAGTFAYAVSSSADGGTTWTPVKEAKSLQLVSGYFTSYAAADASHLVAVSGGDPAKHGSMKVSSDGGQTWSDPTSAPSMPERGWAWVGAPGGGMYYAIPVGGAGAFWQSTDKGQTWKQVQVAS